MSKLHMRFGFAPLSALALTLATGLHALGCKQAEGAPPVEQKPPIPVQSEEVTALETPRLLRLTGNLRGAKETDLAANVAGRVVATQIERGQHVERGTLLARVDVSAANLALAEARVQVETSKTQENISRADCERYERLKKTNAVTELEYDQVTAKCKTAPLQIQAAEARQNIAAKNVGDGAIRSPFSGVVTERYVEVGEYVQAASRVVSIAQIDELRLEFSVPEQNFPDVAVGADVHFRVAAYGDQSFAGKVARISGAVRATRDVLVEAAVDNAERKLLPGMFADVELRIGSDTLPSVPKVAVFEHNGKQSVFVVKDGLLEQRVLMPAPETVGRIPVRRGVELGEQVVTVLTPELENGRAATPAN